MALDQSALLELVEVLKTSDASELMRRMLATMLQELVDAEASAFIGAVPHERTDARTNRRNGTRDKVVTTGVGDVSIKIPKTRTGSFFPALLAPRRRIDMALHAVIMQAYIEGVSTRRVDDLVIAMGGTGVSKSEVSRICAQLDTEVATWRTRPLDEHSSLRLPQGRRPTGVQRTNGRAGVLPVVIATGVNADGHRRRPRLPACGRATAGDRGVLDECRDLRGRGLGGVQLVISDAHAGLVAAVGTVLQGAAWQRCRVHFMRNVLTKVPKVDGEMVATWIRTIFTMGTPKAVRAQLDHVAQTLQAITHG